MKSHYKKNNIEVLIMAAGASRRLGQSKQLLKYKGQTLIRKIINEAQKANIGNITVVTGFDHETIESEIADLNINIFYNKEWQEGLGASIRNGVKHVIDNYPQTSAILLAMVDQPYVNAIHFKKLKSAYNPTKSVIVASAYAGTFGVPIIIDHFYFDMLSKLKGDEGAKKILENYIKNIVEIPFEQGKVDIDEQKDMECLNQ